MRMIRMNLKLLALDTSGDACSVALRVGQSVIVQEKIASQQQSSCVLPMVQHILAEAGLALSQLDALAFGRGPGSFTGLRIAAGVIQGLAFAADLPVLPISTLAALAQGVYRQTQAQAVLSAIDARMQEVYWGVYGLD